MFRPVSSSNLKTLEVCRLGNETSNESKEPFRLRWIIFRIIVIAVVAPTTVDTVIAMMTGVESGSSVSCLAVGSIVCWKICSENVVESSSSKELLCENMSDDVIRELSSNTIDSENISEGDIVEVSVNECVAMNMSDDVIRELSSNTIDSENMLDVYQLEDIVNDLLGHSSKDGVNDVVFINTLVGMKCSEGMNEELSVNTVVSTKVSEKLNGSDVVC